MFDDIKWPLAAIVALVAFVGGWWLVTRLMEWVR